MARRQRRDHLKWSFMVAHAAKADIVETVPPAACAAWIGVDVLDSKLSALVAVSRFGLAAEHAGLHSHAQGVESRDSPPELAAATSCLRFASRSW